MTTAPKYSHPAIVLHWLIALLIAINVLLGLGKDWTPEGWERPMIDLHKSIGITVLGLFFLRLGWRMTHKAPAFPADYKKWERVLAHIVHGTLYVLIFALPASGWIHDSAWSGAAGQPVKLFGIIPWFHLGFVTDLDPTTKETVHHSFGVLHHYLGYALYVVLGLHVVGALKHQWIEKKPELQRMWWS